MLIWSISYPVCLPWRWKWEEINIGLSHHLLVHHSEVQLPAEDFDYFPPLWQTRSGLRSLSLLSTFFFLFFSHFFSLLPLLFVFFQPHSGFYFPSFKTHWRWPVAITSSLSVDSAFHHPNLHLPRWARSDRREWSRGQRSQEAGGYCSPLCRCMFEGAYLL